MITISISPKAGRNEQARALFQRAGNAAQAIAVDTRPKKLRDRTRYTRKGRGGKSWLRD
jgi:hypothetical protein